MVCIYSSTFKLNPALALVSKIIWAHPEFGQVIASCSADHTVCIWEEEDGTLHTNQTNLFF